MKETILYLKTGKVIILLLFILSFLSCDNKQNPVPTVYVDFEVDLNDPQYSSVKLPGNYIYLKGGVNGIILYHTVDDEYRAFERTCPYDPECGIVYVSQDKFTAVDTVCCGSVFSLLAEGAVDEGPSEFPLKQYQCIYYSNYEVIHISN